MFGTGSECLVVAVNLYNQCFTFYLCKSISYKNYFQPDKNKSGFPNKVTQVKCPSNYFSEVLQVKVKSTVMIFSVKTDSKKLN